MTTTGSNEDADESGREPAWLVVQTVFFVGVLLGPMVYHVEFPVAVQAVGGLLLAGSALWLAYAYRSLGSSHSPWVAPMSGGRVVTSGAYSYIRHPIYAGWIALSFAWGLVTGSPLVLGLTVALAIFYDIRARTEERRMEHAHAAYSVYRQKVSRLVPRIY